MKHDILGDVIKAARINSGLSQEEFAEMIDCSPRHLMGIENENKKPGYWQLYEIIRKLNIRADDIFYPEQASVSVEKDELIHVIHLCDERSIRIVTAAVREALNTK